MEMLSYANMPDRKQFRDRHISDTPTASIFKTNQCKATELTNQNQNYLREIKH